MFSWIQKIQIRTCLAIMFLHTLVDCSRILAMVPTSVKSHYVVMEPLLKALAARGHQVTVYSSFPQKTSLANFTDVDCSQGTIRENNLDFAVLGRVMGNVFQAATHLVEFAIDDCECTYNTLKLDNFDFENEKYDLVITEMFAGDCYVHFAHKLRAPLISIVTSVPLPWTPDNFGLPDNPSYIPNYLVDFHHDMTLIQRLANTIVLIYSKAVFKLYGNPRTQKLVEKHISGDLPWVGDIAKNSSLLLVNSHFSLSQSRPFPTNVVEVGGIHIKEINPLPSDLQEILDNSTQGVILLTFGTRLLVSTIPQDKLNIMMKAFAKIPQMVLMKYESGLPNAPKNLIVRSWLPQRDVLEHKNVKAFISHGGLASVMEAVYLSKPVLGVPLFADQSLNLRSVAWKSAGVVVDLETMTEEGFSQAIDKVVNDPKILQGMKRLSQQFRDRPMTPLQSAVYWTEYVLRHQGAPHLRPASTQDV